MSEQEDRERNEAAYQRLKPTIDQTYPKGWFVGIADDRIVGDGANLQDLAKSLQAQGLDPRKVLAVEAGVTYPDYVTILTPDVRP